MPHETKDLYNQLLLVVLSEQEKFNNLGSQSFVQILKSSLKAKHEKNRKKNLLEYLKRKAGFPRTMCNPVFDNLVPYPYNLALLSPQVAPAVTGSTLTDSQPESKQTQEHDQEEEEKKEVSYLSQPEDRSLVEAQGMERTMQNECERIDISFGM